MFKATCTQNTYTRNYVTITIGDDGKITLDGTASGNLWYDLSWTLASNTTSHTTSAYYLPETNNITYSIQNVSGTRTGTSNLAIRFNNEDINGGSIDLINNKNVTISNTRIYGVNRAFIYIASRCKFYQFFFLCTVRKRNSNDYL